MQNWLKGGEEKPISSFSQCAMGVSFNNSVILLYPHIPHLTPLRAFVLPTVFFSRLDGPL